MVSYFPEFHFDDTIISSATTHMFEAAVVNCSSAKKVTGSTSASTLCFSDGRFVSPNLSIRNNHLISFICSDVSTLHFVGHPTAAIFCLAETKHSISEPEQEVSGLSNIPKTLPALKPFVIILLFFFSKRI